MRKVMAGMFFAVVVLAGVSLVLVVTPPVLERFLQGDAVPVEVASEAPGGEAGDEGDAGPEAAVEDLIQAAVARLEQLDARAVETGAGLTLPVVDAGTPETPGVEPATVETRAPAEAPLVPEAVELESSGDAAALGLRLASAPDIESIEPEGEAPARAETPEPVVAESLTPVATEPAPAARVEAPLHAEAPEPVAVESSTPAIEVEIPAAVQALGPPAAVIPDAAPAVPEPAARVEAPAHAEAPEPAVQALGPPAAVIPDAAPAAPEPAVPPAPVVPAPEPAAAWRRPLAPADLVPSTPVRGALGYRLPMVSRQVVPDQVVGGVLIRKHETYVILRPGYWELLEADGGIVVPAWQAAPEVAAPAPPEAPPVVRRWWHPGDWFRKR